MNKNLKHIVILTPGFPKEESDTTTIPALQIYIKALRINKPQYHINIITFQYPFTTKKYNWFGATVFPLNGRNKKHKKLFIWRKAKKLLKKINQKESINIIHSFWLGECTLVGTNFTKNNRIKHIATAMGQDVNKNLFLNLFLNKITNNCRIITLSKSHRKRLQKNYSLNSEIISWGVNPKKFLKEKEKTIDIIGVGSLEEIKNLSLFIKIISKVKKHFKHLKVEILGDGSFKYQLQREVTAYKLNDIIIFRGLLPRNAVIDKMSQSKILLHTSTYESFGMVFLEALHSKMNIVSFDVGFAEKLDDWFICETRNEMIKNILRLLNNFKVPTSKTAFSIDETVIKYTKIYNE